MGWIRVVVIGGALAIASSAAVAFQEQTQAPGGPAASAGKSAPAAGAGISLDGGSVTVPTVPKGTVVEIPGLGRLGILPKLDFGLELLYGAADPKRGEPAQPDDDGVALRGSLKHRF